MINHLNNLKIIMIKKTIEKIKKKKSKWAPQKGWKQGPKGATRPPLGCKRKIHVGPTQKAHPNLRGPVRPPVNQVDFEVMPLTIRFSDLTWSTWMEGDGRWKDTVREWGLHTWYNGEGPLTSDKCPWSRLKSSNP